MRALAGAGAITLLVHMVLRFPRTANHEMLALVALLTIGLGGGKPALRWLVPIVFIWSGIQKLISGCWLEGEFLAVSALESDRFRLLQLIVPRHEMTELRAMSPSSIGAGPFHFESAAPLLLSNAIWVLEILLPILLFVPKLRRASAIALLVVLLAIELFAREVLFGLIAATLIALFLARDTSMRVTNRGAIVLLSAVALWPIGQIALVRTHEVDPWELWGFGMYTCPHLDAEVRAFANDRPLPRTDALRAYEHAWKHIGRLASPQAAALDYFASDPAIEAVRFRMTRLHLDDSDHVAAQIDEQTVLR